MSDSVIAQNGLAVKIKTVFKKFSNRTEEKTHIGTTEAQLQRLEDYYNVFNQIMGKP